MLSMQNKLRDFYTTLASIEELSGKVFHDEAESRAEFPYVVWSEQAEDESFEADSIKQEQAVLGFVNLYTTTEFDPIADIIQETLNSINGLSWSLDSRTPYDPSFEGNNVITYSWTWRLR